MRKSLFIGAAIVAAGLAFWAIFASRSSTDAPAPAARTGAMVKFTPANPPRPAPEATLVDRDGKATGLDAMRGKYVLLNFWATWCAPCVSEMPSLLRLHKAMASDRFAVVAVSEDLKGWEAIGPFLKRLDLEELPVLHDPQGAASRAFGVTGLPATVLVGPDGLILGRLVGPAEWDGPDAQAMIRDYMGQAAGR